MAAAAAAASSAASGLVGRRLAGCLSPLAPLGRRVGAASAPAPALALAPSFPAALARGGRAAPAAALLSGGSVRAMSSGGWHAHGMYSGPDIDPSKGVVRWHKLDAPKWKLEEKPIRGQLEEKEYDEKHGRWWFTHKEHERPKLYTTIGRHARKKGLKRTIVRWLYNSPNFKRLLRDPYRKRWPSNESIGARFFAEFCLRPFEKRPLLETAHTLPLYGVGCKFWRAKTADTPDTRGQFFVAESTQFKLRPMRGMIRGTQYMLGRPVKTDIAPVAKSAGSWRYELPEGAHPAIYRPPFPRSLAESSKEEDGEEAE